MIRDCMLILNMRCQYLHYNSKFNPFYKYFTRVEYVNSILGGQRREYYAFDLRRRYELLSQVLWESNQ